MPQGKMLDEAPDTAELAALAGDVLRREDVLGRCTRLGPDAAVWDADRWARLAEVGMTTLCVPAGDGGTGLSVAGAAAIAEEAGRALLPEPLTATNLAMCVLSGPGAPADVAAEVAAGRRWSGWMGTDITVEAGRLVGTATVVSAGAPVALVGTTAGGAAILVDADHVKSEVVDDRDRSRPVLRVDLAGAAPAATWEVEHGRAWLRAFSTVLYAAEAVGAMASAVEKTVAYVAQREQFGRPIGSFQVVKHQCADMWVSTELARAAVDAAARAVDAGDETAGRDVAAAAAFVAVAFGDVAGAAVHLHGGMGYAWESGCHLFVRRALVTRRLLGDADTHRRTLLRALRSRDARSPALGGVW